MVKDVEYYEDLEDAEYQENQTGRDVRCFGFIVKHQSTVLS